MENNAYVIGDLFETRDAFFDTLLAQAEERRLKTGEKVVAMGEQFPGFFLLRSGTFRADITMESGRTKTVCLMTARDLIGASALDERPSSINYTCLTPVTAGFIPKKQFSEWSNEMLLAFAQIQTVKSRSMMRQIEYLRYYSAEERLLLALAEYEDQAKKNENSRLEAGSGMKKQLLCDMLGITNVRLSQLLGPLEKKGRIRMTRQAVFSGEARP